VDLAVVVADITERDCDLILLKHADGFYGVDSIVSGRLGFKEEVPLGEAVFVNGRNIRAHKALYSEVGRPCVQHHAGVLAEPPVALRARHCGVSGQAGVYP
jgi:hypothetical protein